MPYGNPYDQLVFHDGVGRLRGIPDVSLLAPLQQDINELVSARRGCATPPKRMFYDKAKFPNEEDALLMNIKHGNLYQWRPMVKLWWVT